MSEITNQWVKMNPFEAKALIIKLQEENATLLACIQAERKPDHSWSREDLSAFYAQAVEQRNILEREKTELEEHIDRCERLLRCWCKSGTFSNSEELRMETLEMLDGRPEKARPASKDLEAENARLRRAIEGMQKLTILADREIEELKTQLANK
ncbi:MAG: hypothetical protein EBS68_17295 [Rhodobacteraceae bacterium]|nr:hypothetical protein [Paracoccaceae bacterium]